MTCLHNKSVVTCPENNQVSKFAFSGVWIGLATPPYLWQKLNYRHICFEEIKPDRVAVLKLERVRSHCGKKTLLTPGGCAHLHLHKKALTHCCTLHTAHCTLHTAHCTLHIAHLTHTGAVQLYTMEQTKVISQNISSVLKNWEEKRFLIHIFSPKHAFLIPMILFLNQFDFCVHCPAMSR